QTAGWREHAGRVGLSTWQHPLEVELCRGQLGLVEFRRFLSSLDKFLLGNDGHAHPHVSHEHETAVHQEVVTGGTDDIAILTGDHADTHGEVVPLCSQF